MQPPLATPRRSPCTLGGHISDEGRMAANPVTWHELAAQLIAFAPMAVRAGLAIRP